MSSGSHRRRTVVPGVLRTGRTGLAGLAVAGLLGLAPLGCGGPPRVAFSEQWPSRAGEYEDVTEAWTRHGRLRSSYELVLELHATFKSPEWRAAWIEREARLGGLTPEQRAKLVADHQREASDHYEVTVLLTTWDRRENDLHRGDRSVWKLGLVDESGAMIEPSSIERDRRPDTVIRADFPAMGDFTQAYVVRFPRRIELMRPGMHSFKLRIWGPRGAVEVAWNAAG